MSWPRRVETRERGSREPSESRRAVARPARPPRRGHARQSAKREREAKAQRSRRLRAGASGRVPRATCLCLLPLLKLTRHESGAGSSKTNIQKHVRRAPPRSEMRVCARTPDHANHAHERPRCGWAGSQCVAQVCTCAVSKTIEMRSHRAAFMFQEIRAACPCVLATRHGSPCDVHLDLGEPRLPNGRFGIFIS